VVCVFDERYERSLRYPLSRYVPYSSIRPLATSPYYSSILAERLFGTRNAIAENDYVTS